MDKEQLKQQIESILGKSYGKWNSDMADEIIKLIQPVEKKVKKEEPGWEIVQKCPIEGTIWNIRIKSSGKVFQVGDKVVWNWDKAIDQEYTTIKELRIDNDGELRISCKEFMYRPEVSSLSKFFNLRHYEEPERIDATDPKITAILEVINGAEDHPYLVTACNILRALSNVKEGTKESQEEPIRPEVLIYTEDVGNIYSNDNKVYGVEAGTWDVDTCYPKNADGAYYKWFSTVAARDTYIMYNKPVLSLDDIYRMSSNGYITIEKEPLVKKMVEQRIKQ